MSKERALIKDMKILLECTSMGGLQRNADVLIGRAIELLAQPEQEPVVWQYRTKPIYWERWSKWEDCRKESYEDYIRVPLLHDWTYETRELYTSPQKRKIFYDDVDNYYEDIQKHKEECESNFREQQSEEKWYANSLGDEQ